MKKKQKLTRLVMLALFSALIVILTFTPLGYITIGPAIAITTIHLVTILGASILGIKEGAFLGMFWGILCVVKAYQEPIIQNIPFQNPLISVLPRICVGVVTALVVGALLKTKLKKPIAVGIGSLAGTLTNTVLVITALNIFNGFDTITNGVTTTLTAIITTLIGVNGIIEIVAAIIVVPAIYTATEKLFKNKI